MNTLPPPAKHINDLSDDDLLSVFQRLDPHERLCLFEVCSRWRSVAPKAMNSIKHLDLGRIPGEHTNAMLKRCPNLESIIAADKSFGARDLFYLGKHAKVSSVEFYGCTFAIDEPCIAAGLFSADLAFSSPCTKLVLHATTFSVNRDRSAGGWVPNYFLRALDLPAHLTHLQLSKLKPKHRSLWAGVLWENFMHGLERLEHLKCLIFLDYHMDNEYLYCGDETELFDQDLCQDAFIGKISLLKNLEELCVGSLFVNAEAAATLISSLPKLQVLFFADLIVEGSPDALVDHISKHSSLRILVSLGICEFRTELPPLARQRFSNCADNYALPVLRIFADAGADQAFYVADAETNAVVRRVNGPIVEFLERVDVAPIFESVWIAEQIKMMKGNQRGILWRFDSRDTR